MKVGITGHQDLGSQDNVKWATAVLIETVDRVNISMGYTSLAYGADQIFATALSHKKVPYTVVIPCNRYEETFKDQNRLRSYLTLKRNAREILSLDYEEPTGIAFYEAGKRVVELSQLIIAIWFGRKAKNLGGTGDAVEYARFKSKRIIHINPEARKISIF